MFKILNLIADIIIIAWAITEYKNGKSPDWFMFFLGWGLLSIEDFMKLF